MVEDMEVDGGNVRYARYVYSVDWLVLTRAGNIFRFACSETLSLDWLLNYHNADHPTVREILEDR
jgi:hypothetical protein